MPGQDYQGPADPPDINEQRPPLSRRSVLRRTAGFGAIGLVAAAGGATTAAVLSSRSNGSSSQSQQGSAVAASASAASSDAIIIYMPNPKSGEMQIFSGTGQSRHTNHAMAATVMSMAPQ
jgi:FtsH-binding integral membrane protein